MRPFSFLPVEVSGSTLGAARGRPAAPGALGSSAGGRRRWPVGPCGWAGPAERPRPSWGGEGKLAGWKKKREGRDWAERPDGPKVMGKILFRIKFNF
jgi:hypothetical protein